MKEIKRYDVVLVDGVPAHRPSESGRWVKHEDLAAIQEQLSSYSMSTGQADQRKSESDAVRVALGFSADADDVSPSDLLDKIAALQEQVRALAAECANMRNAIDQTIGWQESVDAENIESVRMLVDLKTTSTDAFIREIRAQAVESFLSIISHTKDMLYADSVKSSLSDYACRIRSGEQP